MTADTGRVPATRTPSDTAGSLPPVRTAALPATVGPALAVLRIATGFLFLWAFLDKTFGWGYATSGDRAWVTGGSPTAGFLDRVAVGPLEETFHAWSGAAWADWLFMAGLLAIGLAVLAGAGLRIAAVAGTAMMALMWAAEWPLARHLSDGTASHSTNPLVEYHVIYALVLIVLAATAAGDHGGAGRRWAAVPLVRRHPWLR